MAQISAAFGRTLIPEVKDMEAEKAWKRFRETGEIYHYLKYAEEKRRKKQETGR